MLRIKDLDDFLSPNLSCPNCQASVKESELSRINPQDPKEKCQTGFYCCPKCSSLLRVDVDITWPKGMLLAACIIVSLILYAFLPSFWGRLISLWIGMISIPLFLFYNRRLVLVE